MAKVEGALVGSDVMDRRQPADWAHYRHLWPGELMAANSLQPGLTTAASGLEDYCNNTSWDTQNYVYNDNAVVVSLYLSTTLCIESVTYNQS